MATFGLLSTCHKPFSSFSQWRVSSHVNVHSGKEHLIYTRACRIVKAIQPSRFFALASHVAKCLLIAQPAMLIFALPAGRCSHSQQSNLVPQDMPTYLIYKVGCHGVVQLGESSTRFSLVSVAKVKAHKSFLFTEKFPCLKNNITTTQRNSKK